LTAAKSCGSVRRNNLLLSLLTMERCSIERHSIADIPRRVIGAALSTREVHVSRLPHLQLEKTHGNRRVPANRRHQGGSQDDKHKDWIEVTGVHWGIHQPRSATASTAGGHTAERVEMSDIPFSKLTDLSSPILARLVQWASQPVVRAESSNLRSPFSQLTAKLHVVRHCTHESDGRKDTQRVIAPVLPKCPRSHGQTQPCSEQQ
jgi:hypothetical protein